jgi:hypothetical protein
MHVISLAKKHQNITNAFLEALRRPFSVVKIASWSPPTIISACYWILITQLYQHLECVAHLAHKIRLTDALMAIFFNSTDRNDAPNLRSKLINWILIALCCKSVVIKKRSHSQGGIPGMRWKSVAPELNFHRAAGKLVSISIYLLSL